MIGYVTVGTNDMVAASAFYDALLKETDEKRLIESPDFIAWGQSWEQPMFAIVRPADGGQATPGHGSLVAMVQTGRDQVDKLHARALRLGAIDEGAPSVRGEQGNQGFYAGYCRDRDGNRLCFFFVGEES